MTRRILAIVAAFVFSLAGHALVFVNGTELLMRSQQFRDVPPNALAVIGLVVGFVLVAVAALTIAISSAGVIALGALHVVFGLLMVLLPVSMEFRPPTYGIAMLLAQLNRPLSDGFLFAFLFGTGFLTGVILLVSGLLVRGRTMRTNPVAIIVSIAVSILGFVGVFVAVTGGSYIYRAMLQMLSGRVEVGGVALLLLGSLLVAVTVAMVRWSSAGVIVLGAVLIVVGLVITLAASATYGLLASLSRDLANAIVYIAPNGQLALVGVVLVSVGVGASIRARRQAPAVVADPAVEPETLAPTAYGTEAPPPASV